MTEQANLTRIARDAGWTVTDRTNLIAAATNGRELLRFSAPGVEIDAHFVSAMGFLDVFYLANTGQATSVVDSREIGAYAVFSLLKRILLDGPPVTEQDAASHQIDPRDTQASAWQNR